MRQANNKNMGAISCQTSRKCDFIDLDFEPDWLVFGEVVGGCRDRKPQERRAGNREIGWQWNGEVVCASAADGEKVERSGVLSVRHIPG